VWRAPTILLATALLAVGCGGDDKPSGFKGTSEASRPCPEGTGFVRARDMIGTPPKGYRVAKGDQPLLKTIADQFGKGLGTSARGHDARVLVKRDAVNGTAVIVVNASEQTGDSKNLIAGAQAAEKNTGVDGELMKIAGKDGYIVQAVDGGYIAMAPAGACSIVVLVADTEELVRSAAGYLEPAPT
jgi:hypothetical protein